MTIAHATPEDQLHIFGTEYAKLRQAIIELPSASTEPLTHEQRMVALSDSVPTKPERGMWTAEEYEEKLAEYNQRIGHKLSPLGNYVYRGQRSTDPQDQPIPKSTPEEREANRGFFERWHEERRRARNVA